MSIGSGNFIDPETSIKVVNQVEKYLQENNVDDINSLIGKVEMN